MMASWALRGDRWADHPADGSVGKLPRLGVALAVFAVAVGVRGFAAAMSIDHLSADPDAYRALADTLQQFGIFGLVDEAGVPRATAFRPPLYPYLLSWVSTDSTAIAIAHAILGGLSATLVFLAAWRTFSSIAAAMVAAALVTIDPILIQQSTLVMTETLATTIVAGVLWRWSLAAGCGFGIGQSLQLGGLLAIAFLCRPTFLVWTGLIVLGMLFAGRRWLCLPPSPKSRCAATAVITAMTIVVIGLWTMRNERAVGHPVWATTHGGYTLLLANNPLFYDHLEREPWSDVWDPGRFLDAYAHRYQGAPNGAAFWDRDWSDAAAPSYPSDADEVDDDRLSQHAAIAVIWRRPQTFALSCVYRLLRLWTPFPSVVGSISWGASAAVGCYYLILYFAVACGAYRILIGSVGSSIAVSMTFPIIALMLGLSIVHTIYFSNMRMRAPAIPGLAILAAGCLPRRELEDKGL